jgi:deoxyadenosine/deoxycytidine kinase
MKKSISNLKGKQIYSIEGNIGAGKTTILKIIEKLFKDIAFVEEPISKWQNIGNENLLEKFYENPERWCFSFEFYSMLTKVEALIKAANCNQSIIIIERSLLSNRIFIDISKEMDKLNNMEYNILLKTWDFYIQNVYPQLSGIIYLNTPVDVCVNRIIQRNRNEECNVDKSYLNILHEKFKELSNESTIPTLIVDGNYDLKRDSFKIGENIHNFMYSYQSINAIFN